MKLQIPYFFVLTAALSCAVAAAPAMSQTAETPPASTTALTPDAVRPPGFEDLAEKLEPTVVNVSTTMKLEAPERGELPAMPQFPPGSPFEEFFKNFYDQYQNSKPETEEKASFLGSGFVIDAANGYIVTNNHVIKDAEEIKVLLNDNTSLDATLVGTDEKTDIALLKVKTTRTLTAAVWGDSDKARVGSWVLAIGNPFGLGGTVTAGIVSARHRDINAGPYDEFIQTDASINRGNSGGPMFNTNGEVIGVNTAIFSPSGGSIGIGFAVPSNLAKGVVAQLIKYGKTKRGWLGVRIQEVTPEIAESLGLNKMPGFNADNPPGAMIAGVTAGGPAEKAGVKAGDVILKFDGQSIDEMRKLPRMVAEAEVGKKSTLTLWRKGKEETVTVDLGQLEKAEEEGMTAEKKSPGKGDSKTPVVMVESLGLGLSALTDAHRTAHKIAKTVNGVLVSSVKKGGIADSKGIAAGDVIVEVDQQGVTTPEQVVEKIAAAEKAGHASVLFFVSRRDDMRFVALKLKK